MTARIRAVVVGVDGSRGNEAAIDWAVQRAMAAHRPLCIVAILDKHWPAATYGDPLPYEPERNFRTLSDLRDQLRNECPDLVIDPEVRVDDAVTGLLDLTASASVIVLGHRGLGAVGSAIRGSTSMAVAGRSVVPTIVVPPDWNSIQHDAEPVVAGRHPILTSTAVMSFAFAEAHWRQVDLIILDVMENSRSGNVPRQSHCACQQPAAQRDLSWLQSTYPDVHCEISHPSGRPGQELLRKAKPAQLLVVGRHHRGLRGFQIGSTARTVLYDAHLPVAVIPQELGEHAKPGHAIYV